MHSDNKCYDDLKSSDPYCPRLSAGEINRARDQAILRRCRRGCLGISGKMVHNQAEGVEEFL